MADLHFETELLILDHLSAGSREEILNTADRLSAEIGFQAGRIDSIITGDRVTGIDLIDGPGSTIIDTLGIIRTRAHSSSPQPPTRDVLKSSPQRHAQQASPFEA